MASEWDCGGDPLCSDITKLETYPDKYIYKIDQRVFILGSQYKLEFIDTDAYDHNTYPIPYTLNIYIDVTPIMWYLPYLGYLGSATG